MLFSVLLSSVQGNEWLTRIDKPSPFENKFTYTQFQPSPLVSKLTSKEGGPAFRFSFNCSGVAPATCEMAKKGFEDAGALIANSLRITRTIQVLATFRSFCTGVVNCNLADTLGQASAAAYFPARVSGSQEPFRFYPQALVKQLPTDKELVMNQYDINAEFNADFNFYFSGSGKPIQPNQPDFTFIVAHELTHGLGFDSGYVDYGLVYKDFTNDHYMAPLVFSNGPSLASSKVSFFEPLNVFDGYLINSETKSSLDDIAKQITSFQNPGALLKDFISQFQSSNGPVNAAKAVYALATRGPRSISFKTKNGVVPMYTPNRFEVGSTLVHLDYDTNWQTPDFLMIPAVRNLTGKTVDDIIKSNTNNQGLGGGIYGPNTRAIMNTLGWSLPESPSTISLQISTDINRSKNNAISVSFGLLALLLLIFH